MECNKKTESKGYGNAEPIACQIEHSVNQVLPDNSVQNVNEKPTFDEVQEAVNEVNPDENTLDRG